MGDLFVGIGSVVVLLLLAGAAIGFLVSGLRAIMGGDF